MYKIKWVLSWWVGGGGGWFVEIENTAKLSLAKVLRKSQYWSKKEEKNKVAGYVYFV